MKRARMAWLLAVCGMMLSWSTRTVADCVGYCDDASSAGSGTLLPCWEDADCTDGEVCVFDNGCCTEGPINEPGFLTDGGQVSGSGASLFADFFSRPASTNDWIDVDGDGFAGQLPTFPFTDQLVGMYPQTQPWWWMFQYRSVGSVNGLNEFVENQTIGAIPVLPPTERGLIQHYEYCSEGIPESVGTHCSGTPFVPCEIEFAFMDVPGAWGVRGPEGAAAWDTPPAGDGYGTCPVPSSSGNISQLASLTRELGACSSSNWCGDDHRTSCESTSDCTALGLNGPCVPMPCYSAEDHCPLKECHDGTSFTGRACCGDYACNHGQTCEPVEICVFGWCDTSGDPCGEDGDCPEGETCVLRDVSKSLNTWRSDNPANPDPNEDTIFDFVAAWVPVAIISNRGTGRDSVKFSEAQYLFTSGRLPNGENLVAATRDVGSGTRNAAMSTLGIDTSWGRGDNIGDEVKITSLTNLGPDHQASNCGGSSIMENAVQNRRLAVGYTGVAGSSRAAKDARGGKYEILGVWKDTGETACNTPDNYVRPTIDAILDNCDPCLGYQIAGSGSFSVRGDPNRNRHGWCESTLGSANPEMCFDDQDCATSNDLCVWSHRDKYDTAVAASNPPLDNQQVAEYLNNIFDAIDDFTTGVEEDICNTSRVCETAVCVEDPTIACNGDDDCVAAGLTGDCAVVCVADGDCPGNENHCVIQECVHDSDCHMYPADYCKSAANMPGQDLATTFFLPAGIDCVHNVLNPTEYPERVLPNADLQEFARRYNGMGWGGDTDPYGSNNEAGLVPKRNSLLSRRGVYSDGSGTGSYYYWDGAGYDTVSSGLELAERNRIQGDFNGDAVRDLDDATELVKAFFAPRSWQRTGVATGSGDIGDMDADNAIPEVIGDFDGDGNLTKEDLRYFADGLAMNDGQLNRKDGAVAIDLALADVGLPYPWADRGTQLVPPAAPPADPTFNAPTDIGDLLKTGKAYAPGDFRGDVAGDTKTGPVAGAQPLGWDGLVDSRDIDYVCRNLGDWSNLAEAVMMDLSCDMNGDMAVDTEDVRELVEVILGTEYGDANLDGVRNTDDEVIVLATMAAGSAGCNSDDSCGWADGDFNCDGVVDDIDLTILNDSDGDGVVDDSDNCPSEPNPDQEDFDGDGTGDACDVDIDGDGVTNDDDVCDLTPNGAEINPDGSTVGDLDDDCDVDVADYAILQTNFTGPNS